MNEKLFQKLLLELVKESKKHFKSELKGILLFGSTVKYLKKVTDIDLLICIDPLPEKRRKRFEIFDPVEKKLRLRLERFQKDGGFLHFSPILRTEKEILQFSPLYLDMVDCSKILYDSKGLLRGVLKKTKEWIKKSGAYRVKKGLLWYWVLKPDAHFDQKFKMGWSD